MVDAVVSFVVERLGDYLIREAVFLKEVRNEVQWLKDELEWMQYFIKDAEDKQLDDAMIGKWISDIKDIAYDTEDVLDKFILKIHDEGAPNMLEEHGGETLRRRPGLFASIKKCCCVSNQNSSCKRSSLYSKGKEKVDLYGIGKEIEALRQRINDLSRKRELYRLQDIGKNREASRNTLDTLKELRKAQSFSVEQNVIGFEDETRELLGKLLGKEPQRFVISIYGMGGLGKTTLAKKLYHNNAVKNKFHHRAWVSVSEAYNVRDVLLRIIESFDIVNKKRNDGLYTEGEKKNDERKKIEKMSTEQLERYIHEFLQGRTTLLVIDDVWQKEAWERLKRAFPDDKNGSRVIITTRIKEVAERSDDRTYCHQLRFLDPNESWNLFCVKAFQNLHADDFLENVGREMVEKCRGLPLAIVVLGGLLSTKRAHEWREVRDHIWKHLREDSIKISALLDLSFNDLPYQLKLCFLYLGLFPEDFEINVQNLIRLLVAEGFICEAGDLVMEDVAEDNVKKLINRSLLQVEKKCWGRVRTCRVHDLLRDLAILKARELKFINVCDGIRPSSSHSSILSSSRRQAIYSVSDRDLLLEHCNPLSRSLLFFNQPEQLTSICSRFSVLRVLDVEVLAERLPKEVGRLIHLRYLGLRIAGVYKIPASIVNLRRLQTLKLNTLYDQYITLPAEIFKLLELRHLVGYFSGPLRIENLKNLLTLKHISCESWDRISPERLVHLRELRVQLAGSYRQNAFSLETIGKLKSLRSLSVWFSSHLSITSLQSLVHCPFLVELRLSGKIENLPSDIHELLPNLESLKLANSVLQYDPMPLLGKLPNLMFLVLERRSYIGMELICRGNGFPRLEILQLVGLSQLKELQVDENSMPMLRGLKITENSNLKIPERLKSVPLPGKWECTDRLDINNFRYTDI